MFESFFAAVRELEQQQAVSLDLPPLAMVPPERMRAQLAQGLPLLPLVPPPVPVDGLLGGLDAYREVLARFQPELAAELHAQAAALTAAAPVVRAAVAVALMQGDAGALYDLATGDLGVAPERLYFLGELAVRPYLIAYAERLEGVVDLTGYTGGRCPVCGRAAFFGHIDLDNMKHLHCPACETTWRAQRVGCTACGCTDPAKVGFFSVEGDDERRVDTCGECGHYLKVIDQRVKARPVDFLLEDAATYHLDRLAQAEGFAKGGRPVAVQ